MSFETLADTWNRLGELDPMWAILSAPDYTNNRWDCREFFKTGPGDVQHVMEVVRSVRFPLRRRKALDFGCGLGRLTQALARYFDEVSGVDIAPSMIYPARGHNPYGDRCKFYVNQRDDLKLFDDGQFDFVLSCIVLQHMQPDYAKKYIAEFMRILTPGGLLVFQQPSHVTATPIDESYKPASDRSRNCTPRADRFRRRGRLLMQRTADRIARRLGRPNPQAVDASKVAVPKYKYLPPVIDWEDGHMLVDSAQIAAARPHFWQTPESQQRTDKPEFELHTIHYDEMLSYLRSLGGKIVFVEEWNKCGPNHPSFGYYVTK